MGSASTIPLASSSSSYSLFVICFFLLSQFALQSAQKYPSSRCHPFKCQNLYIGYPFSNDTNPQCGLSIINCGHFLSFILKPILQMGDTWLNVESIFYHNKTLVVHYQLLTEQLKENNCSLLPNFTIPNSIPLSFEVKSQSVIILICKPSSLTYLQLRLLNTTQRGYRLCGDHDLYFLNDGNFTQNWQSSFAPLLRKHGFYDRCRVVRVPVGDPLPQITQNWQVEHLFSSLETGFSLQWSLPPSGSGIGERIKMKRKLIIAASLGCGMIVIVLVCCTIWKSPSNSPTFIWKKRTKNAQNVENFLKKFGNLVPKRYSYSEIKKMTNSFKTKLGQGGFGGVFKGKLLDGRLVAVKVLSEPKGDGEEFINEVASISRTSHVNVVNLIGFCFDGFKRALVYEFMPNGSLEKFIYDDERKYKADLCLGWERIYQIAIGIARGLEYLHRGCSTRILHFDIKPHNILLDQDFCPKISDFGLAKLCLEKDSVVSMAVARGTIGYIAPEVFSKNFGAISHKSDVYSYGMMILEMVGGRMNKDVVLDHTSETYFPHWIYKHLSIGENFGLHRVMTTEEEEVARKMILVGLWCIQAAPSNRPSIRKVIEMLEGNLESLQLPPKPIISSPQRSTCSSPTSIKCCSEMYLDSSFL